MGERGGGGGSLARWVVSMSSSQFAVIALLVCVEVRVGVVREGGRSKGEKDGGWGVTSDAVTMSAFQSTLGSTLNNNFGFGAMVSDTNSQSFGCRGKEAEVDLQAFTAQVRKLRVRTFIF